MILVDINEPDSIIKLLKQSVDVVTLPLNIQHRSDYFFTGYSGQTFQFSRKQAGELLGNIDEAEAQLADYYSNADRNCQIVEGIISSVRLYGHPVEEPQLKAVSTRSVTAGGHKMYGYKVEPTGYARGHSFNANDSMLHAWIHRLAEAGIPTYYTINWVATARLLVAIHNNEQKPPEEHSTLNRVVKPRLYIKKHDPFIESLMYLSSAYRLDIGEKRAKALSLEFANLFDIATSTVERIASCEGVGRATARKLLTALGRTID